MKSFFKGQIEEIQSSRVLQLYGALLGLSNILTAYFWWSREFSDTPAICWSFFQNCQVLSPISQNANSYLIIFAMISFLASLSLILKRGKEGYILLLFAFALKMLFQITDYRLMGNYHYMNNIIQVCFLFVFEKTNMIRLFLVLFYMAASLIKFNTDWLSGSALIRPSIFSGKLLEIACAYVIVLELVLAPLLVLVRNKIIKYAVLVQLIIFHIFSWHIVGYLYPLTMFFLISLFFLDSNFFNWPKTKTNLFLIFIFIASQAYVAILEPQSSLNGRNRLLSLNMLDARAVCETRFILKYKNEIVEYIPDFLEYGMRIRCDPLIVLDHIKKTCEDQKMHSGFLDIDIDHQVRRFSESDQLNKIEQLTFQDVCQKSLHIGILGNIWQN